MSRLFRLDPMMRPAASIAEISRHCLGAVCLLLLALAPAPARAQEVGIAAIVNDQIISLADVDARTSLLTATSSIPQSVVATPQFRSQVLHMLITEKLQIQEAKREGVLASDDDVKEAYAGIERGNSMPPGSLDRFLASKGVDKQTLLDQLKAQVSWERLVHARYGPELVISDQDVNAVLGELRSHAKEPQTRVADIFLPVSEPSQDAQVADIATRLMDEIRHGAQFQQVAKQFSQDSSAANGGDLGWLSPGMLSPDIERIIQKMQPGAVGGPFRLTGGYYILALIERRAPTGDDQLKYNLSQVVFPLADTASDSARQSLIEQAKETTENARSCDDLNSIGRQVSPQISGPLGDVGVSDVPAPIKGIVASAKVAVPMDPVRVPGGVAVYMVCGKSGGGTGITKDQVMQNLMRQRYENISQRYMGDLQRLAYIDRRI